MKPPFLLFAACLAVSGSTGASEPSTTPLLRIEVGVHTAPITAVSADVAGRLGLTVSDDKTARLWELPGGRLLRVLRPPIGQGREGMLFCGALSPDGRLAAVGGWTGEEWDGNASVYLFETATGRMVSRLPGLTNVSQHLAFSPSGRWLAAGDANGSIAFWKTAGGQELAFARDGEDSCTGLDWRSDEQLVATFGKGGVQLYAWSGEPSLELKPVHTTHLGPETTPGVPSFSPDGKRIAIGFENTASVTVLAAGDLSHLYNTRAMAKQNGGLSNVAWSADGMTLMAGGNWPANGTFSNVRCWCKGGKGHARDLTVTNSNINTWRRLPGDRLFFATDDRTLGILNRNGGVVFLAKSRNANFENAWKDLRVSADGARVSVGDRSSGAGFVRFDLHSRETYPASAGQAFAAGLHKPRITGLPVHCWQGSASPDLDHQRLELEEDETAHCLAIAQDNSFFVLGSILRLHCFANTGFERWNVETADPILGVNLSSDGRLVVAACEGGVVRWYRTDTGEELLAFFPHPDRTRWVAWTPRGYYDCSPNGEELLGWHINHGGNQAAEFLPAAKFRDEFHRPDVIRQILAKGDVTAALEFANAAGRR